MSWLNKWWCYLEFIHCLTCSSAVASWTTTLKDSGSNMLETFKFFHFNFITILKVPGSNPLNMIMMMINTEAKANCLTVIYPTPFYWYLEDSNQEPSVWKYSQRLKYQWKNIYLSSRFKSVSFRVNIHNATTELPEV